MVVVSFLLIGLSALQTTSASYIPSPLLARDNSTTSPASATCAAPPLALQTFYPIWDAPKNAKGEDGSRLAYGPPNVPNKNRFGQPEAGSTKPKVKNVIFSVPDGFGPASQVFARNYWQWEQNKTWDDQLPADKLLIGTVRTRSSDSFSPTVLQQHQPTQPESSPTTELSVRMMMLVPSEPSSKLPQLKDTSLDSSLPVESLTLLLRRTLLTAMIENRKLPSPST
ncbi:hypothetical protein BDY24DRAFT_32913 [Mrakia frigida]|uniref:uncharacterized protein n=1 Tax=Mrakia frigida TaxID=29902 RepID=UPI003FCBFBB0